MLDQLLQNTYLKDIFVFFTYFIVAFFVAVIVNYILKTYVKKITKRTKTDLDDFLLKNISKPIFIFILLIGLYLGIKYVFPTHLNLANNILFVVSVFFITYISSQLFVKLVSDWMKVKKGYERTPKLISKVISITIYLIAILMVLNYFNISITPLIATLGIGGLAIGLALQGTLANLFAGIHIISDKPVNVGDFIELTDTVRGFVHDIGWRSTKIRTFGNNIYVIPNAKLADSIIHNMSLQSSESSLVVNCGVGYGMDLEKVEKITLKVAKSIQGKIEGTVKEYEPIMRYTDFGDSNINFFIVLRLDNFINLSPVRHAFIKALKKEYDKNKINISWPMRKVVMAK